MKKKMISFMLTAVMAGTMVFTGCGNADKKEKGSGENGEISGSITVWEHDYSAEDSLISVIEGFSEEYPNVEVNYEIKADGDYYSILQTAVQSGDGPDLFWTHGTATTTMNDLVANGVCEDLTDKVDYSFISDSAMELADVEGKSYSVPWMTLDTRTCYYNKDMFKENGWKVPKTFSEFETLLASIKKEGITPISMAYAPWSLLFLYEPMMLGSAPDYTAGLEDYSVKATDQPARDAMQKLVDWSKEGYFGDNWFGVLDNSAQILAFTTGKAAMNVAGSWDAATISMNNPDLNYGAFTIPTENGETGLIGTAANGFSVNADSQNLEAATAFANYCATKEAQTRWIQTLGAVSGSPEIEASSEIAQEISESGDGKVYRSWQNVLSSYSSTGNASTVWEQDFPQIFTGDMTVNQLMDDVAAEMQ